MTKRGVHFDASLFVASVPYSISAKGLTNKKQRFINFFVPNRLINRIFF